MSELKCPFCQQELRQGDSWTWGCVNDDCESAGLLCGTKELWQELIRTRKALDYAKKALEELRPAEKKGCYLVPTVFTTQRIIDEALEQITALEQKD